MPDEEEKVKIWIHSLDTKHIHVCRMCGNIGGWKSFSEKYLRNIKKDVLRCPRCDAEYTIDEWRGLQTIEVPALSELIEENESVILGGIKNGPF